MCACACRSGQDICAGGSTNPCSVYATCTQTGAAVACECKPGFTDVAQGVKGRPGNCRDVDECTVGPNPCGSRALPVDVCHL